MGPLFVTHSVINHRHTHKHIHAHIHYQPKNISLFSSYVSHRLPYSIFLFSWMYIMFFVMLWGLLAILLSTYLLFLSLFFSLSFPSIPHFLSFFPAPSLLFSLPFLSASLFMWSCRRRHGWPARVTRGNSGSWGSSHPLPCLFLTLAALRQGSIKSFYTHAHTHILMHLISA